MASKLNGLSMPFIRRLPVDCESAVCSVKRCAQGAGFTGYLAMRSHLTPQPRRIEPRQPALSDIYGKTEAQRRAVAGGREQPLFGQR